MFKRVLSMSLVICMSILMMAGCGQPKTSDTSKSNTSVAQEGETRTIVDQLGNTVVLPKEVNRVVIASAFSISILSINGIY